MKHKVTKDRQVELQQLSKDKLLSLSDLMFELRQIQMGNNNYRIPVYVNGVNIRPSK